MVNLAGIMERADEALLPGVYHEIGLALNASPAKLGSLTLVRSLVQALCAPLAAYASVHHNRRDVIALGAVLWAIATFFVGISATFTQVVTSLLPCCSSQPINHGLARLPLLGLAFWPILKLVLNLLALLHQATNKFSA